VRYNCASFEKLICPRFPALFVANRCLPAKILPNKRNRIKFSVKQELKNQWFHPKQHLSEYRSKNLLHHGENIHEFEKKFCKSNFSVSGAGPALYIRTVIGRQRQRDEEQSDSLLDAHGRLAAL
jgi:hypothetical protein